MTWILLESEKECVLYTHTHTHPYINVIFLSVFTGIEDNFANSFFEPDSLRSFLPLLSLFDYNIIINSWESSDLFMCVHRVYRSSSVK